jgi:outer membrane receptor for monomeric catechols
MAAYSFRFSAKVRGRLQLNIRNLLDRRRYEEVNLSQTRYEAPRSLSLTTTLSF